MIQRKYPNVSYFFSVMNLKKLFEEDRGVRMGCLLQKRKRAPILGARKKAKPEKTVQIAIVLSRIWVLENFINSACPPRKLEGHAEILVYLFSRCKDRAFMWGVQEIFRLFRPDIATGGIYRDTFDEPLPDLSRHTESSIHFSGSWTWILANGHEFC